MVGVHRRGFWKLRLFRYRVTNVVPGSAGATIKNPFENNGGTDAPKTWGAYTPNFGYKVANTERGDMSISIYSYVRYLNQKNLAPTYTNYFGVTSTLQQRQDVQINKVQIKFLGWMLDPKLRYFLYAWTSNASQGLGGAGRSGRQFELSIQQVLHLGWRNQISAGHAQR